MIFFYLYLLDTLITDNYKSHYHSHTLICYLHMGVYLQARGEGAGYPCTLYPLVNVLWHVSKFLMGLLCPEVSPTPTQRCLPLIHRGVGPLLTEVSPTAIQRGRPTPTQRGRPTSNRGVAHSYTEVSPTPIQRGRPTHNRVTYHSYTKKLAHSNAELSPSHTQSE